MSVFLSRTCLISVCSRPVERLFAPSPLLSPRSLFRRNRSIRITSISCACLFSSISSIPIATWPQFTGNTTQSRLQNHLIRRPQVATSPHHQSTPSTLCNHAHETPASSSLPRLANFPLSNQNNPKSNLPHPPRPRQFSKPSRLPRNLHLCLSHLERFTRTHRKP